MSEKIKLGDKTVTGNLAADPQVVVTQDGKRLTTLRVLENQRVFSREQQQWVDGETTGYDVAIGHARLADNALKGLHKGDRVTVRGEYQVSPYVNRSTGEAGLNHRVSARDVSVSMFNDRMAEQDVSADLDQRVDQEVGTSKSAVDHVAWLQRDVPWAALGAQTDRSVSDRIPVEALEQDPALVEEVYKTVPAQDTSHWAAVRQGSRADVMRFGRSVTNAYVDAAVAGEITEHYPAADIAEKIAISRRGQVEDFVQAEMVHSIDDPVSIAPRDEQAQWAAMRENILAARQAFGLSTDDEDVNAEFAEQVIDRYSVERVAELIDTHEQAIADKEQLAAAGFGERAPLSGPGTPPPPGPPEQNGTIEFGEPMPSQRRDDAKRKQRPSRGVSVMSPEHLAAQKLNDLPTRPGTSGPSM